MNIIPGTRVVAISHGDKDKILKIFGRGTYVGDEKPPVGTLTPFGEVNESFPQDWTNPKIILDNGTIVWGCQCWWGPEEVVENKYKDYKWEEISTGE